MTNGLNAKHTQSFWWRCARGTHPFSSRTRRLRPGRPMVLCRRRHGRAGGRQIFGGIAQLGEHLPCKQGVRGSNPLTSTVARVGAHAAGFDGRAGRKACFSDEACGKDGECIRRMHVMKQALPANPAKAAKATAGSFRSARKRQKRLHETCHCAGTLKRPWRLHLENRISNEKR